MCYQFEIKCPCVLKPGVGNYLLSAKLVITVTRSALRLPVSTLTHFCSLLSPGQVCPSSKVQDEIPQLEIFFIVSTCLFNALSLLCPRNTLYVVFLWWQWRSAFDCSCVVKAHVLCQGARARTQTICIRKRLGGKMPVINDTSPTLQYTILGFHNPSSDCVKVCLWCMEDL